jgi:copper chaperone CopZ
MRISRLAVISNLCVALALSGAARADTTVELKGVHLCCRACVKDAAEILNGFPDVKHQLNQQAKTITITAPDDAAAQKVLDALAGGGFHGTTDNPNLTIKDDSGAAKGKVETLTISGIHNCCGACTVAINRAAKKADGVKESSAKPKQTEFTVKGDFEPTELVKALNAAGFHVKVKQ